MPQPELAPGKLVVELTQQMNALVSPLIPDNLQGGVFTSFDVPLVDAALALLSVQSITRLYGDVEPAEGVSAALIESMRATYVLRFSEDTDLDFMMSVLGAASGFANIEPVGIVQAAANPNDPIFAGSQPPKNQWGLAKIRAPEAWDRQTGSYLVNITVVDSGCDKDHPDLAPRLMHGWDFCEDPRPPAPWKRTGDFTSPDPDPQDELGHGTSIAGILGAATNNGIGISGVTWSGNLFPARVVVRTINADTGEISSISNTDEVAKAIKWAGTFSHVINVSLVTTRNTRHLGQAVEYAVQRGATITAAMGNDNNNIPNFPAAYPGVIAVGAISETGERWVVNPTVGSNTGLHISISAPGANIWSTDLFGSFGSRQYSSGSGTSLAAPYVAGVAALLYSCNRQLQPSQVKTIIEQTANRSIPSGDLPWPNSLYGNGVVDARAAVDQVLDGPIPPP